MLRQSRSVLRLLMGLVAVGLIGISPWTSAASREPVLLADPTVPLEEAWMHQRFRGETEYKRVSLGGVAAIRAVGRNSASGLYREVMYRIAEHPWLEWTWRVDQLQQDRKGVV